MTKQSKKPTDERGLWKPCGKGKAAERAKLASAEIKDAVKGKEPDLTLENWEGLGSALSPDDKKALVALVTDIFPNRGGPKQCAQITGIAKTADLEYKDIVNRITTKHFPKLVKAVGQGIIGSEILPIVQKFIELAKDGDKTCIRWAFEMFELLPSKHQMMAQVKIDNRKQTINYSDKSDDELAAIVAEFKVVNE